MLPGRLGVSYQRQIDAGLQDGIEETNDKGRIAEEDATQTSPANHALGIADENAYLGAGTAVTMGPNSVSSTGQGQAHDNVQPYLVLNFICALVGVYPSPS